MVVEDVCEDEDYKSESWVSTTEYANANGSIVSGCLKDIKNFLKNEKLDQVVVIVKSFTPNVIDDLTATLKDLSVTIPGTIYHKVIDEGGYGNNITIRATLILANVSVFSPKPLMHYLNIIIRNVVKVSGSGSGVGGSGMLMEEEEIMKLMEEEKMDVSELQVCRNVTDQEDLYKFNEEALNLALEEEAMQARAEQECTHPVIAIFLSTLGVEMKAACALKVEAVRALDLVEALKVEVKATRALDLVKVEASCLVGALDVVGFSLNILISASIQILESTFKDCQHPDDKTRMQLSRELGLAPRQIKFWFQNRRTQMKAQHERADNCALRSENDKIRCENIVIREALKNLVCPTCGGPPIGDDCYFDEQKLRFENAQLKEEVNCHYQIECIHMHEDVI
nr:homeobox-leucine zipper protein HDG11 [Tanacetum cinerariifolium]